MNVNASNGEAMLSACRQDCWKLSEPFGSCFLTTRAVFVDLNFDADYRGHFPQLQVCFVFSSHLVQSAEVCWRVCELELFSDSPGIPEGLRENGLL